MWTPKSVKSVFYLLLSGCVLFASGCSTCSSEKESQKPKKREPNVIFIVVDTVRSDHTSLCGYSIDTTPTLKELAHQDGASYTCDAITPGSWTLPSHASFFTGVDPAAHGADSVTGGVRSFDGWGSHNRNLGTEFPTLGELMQKKGFLSAAFSANPVVSAAFGLMRGFEETHIAKDWYQYFGNQFGVELDRFMKRLPKDKPLFLFVNIADAHQPWAPIPEGIPWAEPAPRFSYPKERKDSFWRVYVEGRATPEIAEKELETLRDYYDYALSLADKNLEITVNYLEDNNWCDFGCRYIVVADHGEFLGEHKLLDHGHYVYEPVVQVPLVIWGFDSEVKLPAQVSATEVYHLVQHDKPITHPFPITSMAFPHERRCHHTEQKAFCSTSAAIWHGDEKLLFMDDKYYKINLAEDPGENNPIEIDEAPGLDELKKLAARVISSRPNKTKELDTEALEQLRALGYLN